MSLCVIAPRLPPAIDGVGDYCYRLWEHWPEAAPRWQLLVTEKAEASQADWPQVLVRGFERSEAGLLSALTRIDSATLVLHYVGYGYAPSGAPDWLPRALRQWKAERAERRVVVVFHELYAVGPIWRRAFWTKRAQRRIVAELVALADRWTTSCPRYWTQLQEEFAAEPRRGALVPVGANIVPARSVDLSRTWPLAAGGRLRLVVFGLPHTRLRALATHADLVKALCERGWVESITLLGRRDSNAKTQRQMAQCQAGIGHAGLWREAFDLPADAVSGVLLEQDLGLLGNTADTLTKSGVFAALSAHGVLPLVRSGHASCQAELGQAGLFYERGAQVDQVLDALWNERVMQEKRRTLAKLSSSYLSWHGIAAAQHAAASAQPAAGLLDVAV
ncbi:hypothetical protein RG903_02600 [Thermithiobacillus tepidarius DSM 3134]|uniref:hypothetical protein n=1 Tax=Thermithiobacillus tepidarius TaxID=929 RepID=UPI000410ADF2